MEESAEEKYLGDIISKDGRNMINIKARVNKGTGIVTRIMTLLDGIPFGKYYFEIAMILRNCLLVSSVLNNSEAWYNLTNAELDYLETVDMMFLRNVLKNPSPFIKFGLLNLLYGYGYAVKFFNGDYKAGNGAHFVEIIQVQHNYLTILCYSV